jgi:hypothetical protein
VAPAAEALAAHTATPLKAADGETRGAESQSPDSRRYEMQASSKDGGKPLPAAAGRTPDAAPNRAGARRERLLEEVRRVRRRFAMRSSPPPAS